MRRLATILILASFVGSVGGCTVRSRRPDGPYRHAEEFADALSDATVDCTREHTPSGQGSVSVAAEFTAKDQPPVIHDAGSMPGSDAVLECVRKQAAEKLRSPEKTPARYARIRVPVPVVTSEVTYAFMPELRPGN